MRRRLRILVAAVGVATLAVTTAGFLFPDAVVSAVGYDVDSHLLLVDRPAQAVLALGGIVAIVAAYWKGITAGSTTTDSLAPDVGSSAESDYRIAGESLSVSRDADEAELEEGMAAVASRRIATARGKDADEAEELVARGEWTDDRVATGFLGDERAPEPGVGWRLYAWLYGDRAFQRSVERTVAAIEAIERSDPRLSGGHLGSSESKADDEDGAEDEPVTDAPDESGDPTEVAS